jgi:hypothetical protein
MAFPPVPRERTKNTLRGEWCQMNIWAMWYQGRGTAPPLCRGILELWEELHPGYRFRVIERDEAMAMLDGRGLRLDGLGLEKIANLVRIDVLAREGGVWVDATLLPVRPLGTWFHGVLDSAGFFAFRDPGKDRIVCNWFLFSEAGHPLATNWRDWMFDFYKTPRKRLGAVGYRSCRSLRDVLVMREARRPHDPLWYVDPDRGRSNPISPYFAMHYNFAEMLRRNPDLQALWDAVPYRSGLPPFFVKRAVERLGEAQAGPAVAEMLTLAPIHKVTHKDRRFAGVLPIALDLVGLGKSSAQSAGLG